MKHILLTVFVTLFGAGVAFSQSRLPALPEAASPQAKAKLSELAQQVDRRRPSFTPPGPPFAPPGPPPVIPPAQPISDQ